MTKGQKRLAAIVLALLGIYGTMAALEDRVAMKEQTAVQNEAAVETVSLLPSGPMLDRFA